MGGLLGPDGALSSTVCSCSWFSKHTSAFIVGSRKDLCKISFTCTFKRIFSDNLRQVPLQSLKLILNQEPLLMLLFHENYARCAGWMEQMLSLLEVREGLGKVVALRLIVL